MRAITATVLVIFLKVPFRKFPDYDYVNVSSHQLRNNISILKDILQLKILRTWIKVHASSFIKTSVNIQRRCLENYHSKKNATPHFKEHCTKTDDIWLVIIRFFLSQANLVFIDILHSFSNSLFTFLAFDFWYSTYFQCSTEFMQCLYAFFIKTSKVLSIKMFLLCLNFHETFFPLNGDFC